MLAFCVIAAISLACSAPVRQKYAFRGRVSLGARLQESPFADSCFDSVGRETVEEQERGREEERLVEILQRDWCEKWKVHEPVRR